MSNFYRIVNIIPHYEDIHWTVQLLLYFTAL